MSKICDPYRHYFPLAYDCILPWLTPSAANLTVVIEECCQSTNTLLLEKLKQKNATHGHVIVCESQTAGRGRNGRTWQSPSGSGLTFSLAWAFTKDSQSLMGLSLAVGVALINALRKLEIFTVQLKWPNDLLWRDCKLGGTLIELHRERNHPMAVIGIGINTRLPDDLRKKIDQPTTDLEEIARRPIDRNQVLAIMLNELIDVLTVFVREGFTAFQEAWSQYDAYLNRPVRLFADKRQVEGRVMGIDQQGALLLHTQEKIERFFSGDLSLRPIA